jgi:hypothetical protein
MQVHMLNGERYNELCAAAGPRPSPDELRDCVLAPPSDQRPLLRRDGGANVAEDGRIILTLQVRRAQRGQNR